jgi:hypothetical protein
VRAPLAAGLKSDEFMAVKKPAKKTKAAKKFKGVRAEKNAGKNKKARAWSYGNWIDTSGIRPSGPY